MSRSYAGTTITCLDCNRRAGHYSEFISLDGRPNQYQAMCRKCHADFERIWAPNNPWWIKRRIRKSEYITLLTELKL